HPYPAMLHPRLVQYLIEQYSAEGDIVVDPFLGSGVTAVESTVRERIFYGWDINPLAILISQVRATPINRSLVIQNLTVFKEKYSSLVPEKPGFPNIEYWFLPKTIVSLAKLKHLVKEVQDLSIRRFLFAIADARVGKTNIEEFFYEEMYLYSDPSAERFLSAFENSYVLLDIRMHAKTDNTVRNHGTAFRIPENRLSELYNRVERLV
ncbi:MAG: MvaI/BcnI family restriction endonuclease, partial [bacterium]